MSDHEIFSVKSASARLAFSGGELKTKESDASKGYGVRALKDGRIGFGYCQDEGDIQKAIEEAEKLSRFSVRSGFSFAPKAGFSRLDLADQSFITPDFEMLKSYVDDSRSPIEKKGGKARVICSIDSSEISVENSAGFSGSYPKTVFSVYAECMHGDGFGYSYLTSHNTPGDLNALGEKAADMAISMQSAGRPESGEYTVVMEPEALDNLIETLLPSLSGDWKRRGITRLRSGMKLHESLTICEDGLSPGIGARPFDDEGTPTEKRSLIENGTVKSFLYDRETAALEGSGASGCCTRPSYDSPPSISASNIVVSPGDWKDLGELERYIELHYAHGSHTANLTSGDIGLEASAAFLVEKGKRKPIKGFMVSGNVFDIFSNIAGIESVPRVYGSLISPRIAFAGLKVVS
ncbi:MAG: TldD/PmbA family protein [Candidatus Micrarchaeia archaeon]